MPVQTNYINHLKIRVFMTEQLHEISHLIEPSIIWNHFCRGMLFTKIIHEHCCHETFVHSRNDFCYRRLRPINSLGCSIYTPHVIFHYVKLTPILFNASIAFTAFCHFRLNTNFFNLFFERDRSGNFASLFWERLSQMWSRH